MQILEVLIYILSIILIWILMSKKKIKKQYILTIVAITVFVLLLQVLIVGTRWQLYTLYTAVIAIGVMVSLQSQFNIELKSFLRRGLIIVLTFFIVFSVISTLIFPLYEIPMPNGSYLIGTESFVIEDENRLELYSDDSNDFRKIKVQFWYPASSTNGYEQAPWLEDGLVVARALSNDTGLPYFVLDHVTEIMSNSYIEAPISNQLDNYPVIILSHGWRGFRNLHTDYAEELASLGYIVIGIDHTYGSVATVFSDDDISYLNLDALPAREEAPNFLNYANQLVNTYAFDVTMTLNYLEEINDSAHPSRFSGKLDLTKIGLLGHSTGGGADVQVAINDNRIDAVLGLDAWVEPIDQIEIDKGLSIPALFLRSGAWETGFNNTKLYTLIESSSYPSKLYQIDGTTHYDFAMVYMYSPLTPYIGFSGSVESKRLISILKSMISDFFNETLRNDPNSQIDVNTWEEVRIITTG